MNNRRYLLLTVAALLAMCAASSASNLILNGDFENTSAGTTQFNLSNAAFNALMPNVTAFGTAQEIDIITSTDFGIAPESGNWKLGIHTQSGGAYDAFSMTLSSPLVAGNTYSLQFFGAQLSGFVADIIIGVSNSPTSFGTQIFSAVPTSPTAWSQFNTSFTAPISGSYITVQNLNLNDYSFVDNFSLTGNSTIPEPSSLVLLGTAVAGLAGGLRRKLKG
ncbi:MAG TPA: PEP-CTERM sorting domain-containing protein [Candidatus Eisenbacteria bacterium]|nr:PEP-CTERM sorting domain-containing protein [Candidatus Eisenbacteria bacterium]